MGVRLRSMSAVLATWLVSACTHNPVKPEPKSVDFVVQSARALEGTRVQVVGYLRFGDDTHNLWNSKAAETAVSTGYVPADDPRWSRCIALRDFGNYRSTLLRQNNHLVLITGIVNRIPLGPDEIEIGSCSEVKISVLKVEGRR
jgi:hypothetical protein